jgi:hypothetical protein
LPVPAAVEPVADGLTGRRRDRGGAGEHGKRGFGTDPAGVGPGAQHDGGHDRADPPQGEEVGSPRADELQDRLLVLGRFGVQRGDAVGEIAQHPGGVPGGDIPAGLDTQSGAHLDHLHGRLLAEPAPQRLGGGDDQRMELLLRDPRRVDGGAAGGQTHGQRHALAVAAGLGQMLPGQRLPGRSDGVERVGLGAVAASGPVRPVQLDDPLAPFAQVAGQAGAVAAGALDGPHPQAAVPVGQLDQGGVAVRVGVHGQVLNGGAGRCGQHRRGVGVLVGVDADDDIDDVCEHGHCVPPCRDGRVVPVRFGDRQDCDGTRHERTWRSSS